MITVVLPVYNGGQLFRRCVESIARQDAPPGAFDVIVLDNASTDGSLDALHALPPSISRRVITSERLLSIEENWARIRQLEDVRPYITISGHDDLFDPCFIRVMTAALQESTSPRLLFSHFRLIDGEGAVLRPCQPMAREETAGHFLAGRLAGIRDSFGTGYVASFADYRAVGGIPPYTKLLYADDALWLSIAQRAPMRILEAQCFSYRYHPQSASHTFDMAPYARGFIDYLGLLERLAPTDPGIRWALTTYGETFVRRALVPWMLDEVRRANAAGEPARKDVLASFQGARRALLRLAGTPTDDDVVGPEMAWQLWANERPLVRRLLTRRLARAAMRRLLPRG